MERYEPTDRTKLRRLPARGGYERTQIHSILDQALICHVGFCDAAGQPFVLPMIHGRLGETLYLHGAAGGRGLRALKAGAAVCVTATIVDGLVLARSSFHHSMNYRCVVVLGRAEEVRDDAERESALRAISEHVLPGRWAEARPPNKVELAQTAVVKLALSESSAKVRSGPPADDEADYALPVWAGVLPLRQADGEPVPDERLPRGTPLSPAVARRLGR
jgi:nitroimidazol reductase NimA-like FMN-containing flavoprotein (pyridoxamine 5'-phosphate oxidase superfamily)